MDKRLQGAVSGLLASLILGALYLITPGAPGRELYTVARWLGLDNSAAGLYIGLLTLLLLGVLSGLIFGMLMGRRESLLSRSIGLGIAVGFACWLIVPLLIGTLILQHPMNLSSFLSSFVPLLFYGTLLGVIYFQRTRTHTEKHVAAAQKV